MVIAASLLLLATVAASQPDCAVLKHAIDQGCAVTSADIGERIGCPANLVPGFVLTDGGVIRARRTLAAGEVVDIPATVGLPTVRAGDRLHLQARSGAIAVERPVTVLQEGRAGRMVFVRTSEGAVVSALVLADQP